MAQAGSSSNPRAKKMPLGTDDRVLSFVTPSEDRLGRRRQGGKQMNIRRKTPAVAATFLAACLGTSALTPAAALAATSAEQSVQDFSIAPQPLQSALLEFSKQSQSPVVASTSLISGLNAPAVEGRMAQAEALNTLLAGSGLYALRSSDGGWAISRKAASDPQSGSAAGDGADAGTVQALIVTAQKREENIQDVPIAMSAFTQEDLTRSQVAGGPDLITQVPNMTFTKTNFSSYSIQIRGIGTQAISATTDPAVAVAFNNTPFIRNRFFEQEFYDLERVEVLRGPQGTLYGRNATGGVVNIISAKPKFLYEAKLSADLGNFSSSRLEGMVNIPLVEDKVAVRLAGAWTKRDGYATNALTGAPIDGRDLWSTRLSLRVRPNERINANLIWEHFQENDGRLRSGKQLCKKDVVTEVGGVPTPDFFQTLPDSGQASTFAGVQATFSQGCSRESLYSPDSFQTPNGLMLPYYVPLGSIGLPVALNAPYVSDVQSHDLRVIESTVDPKYRAHSDLGELQFSVGITDRLTLQSETGYNVDSVYSLEDFNRFNTAPGAWQQSSARPGVLTSGPNGGIFCDPQLGCSDRLLAVDVSTAKSRQFSQEFRLVSDIQGAFNFSLGANLLRSDSEDKYYVFINSISLIAANGSSFAGLGPYLPGQSDNSECLQNGYLPGDPSKAYSVTGCVYLDPNPVGQVNDQGHNYFLSKNPYKLISYAVFGEAYYQLAKDLKLTAGLRWTVDKKDAPVIPTWILASESVGYPVEQVIQQQWREPTGRLTIDWKPDFSFTDETMIYASLAHGYKAGGANPPGFVRVYYSDPRVAIANGATSATRPKTFDPEFVNAFEAGAKNTFFEGKATLNVAGFYYDYTGYQVSEIVDRSAFNRNFDATVWGVELESDWRPVENLRLGLKAGYEKTRIADGEQAVDLMDRTAGNTDWLVVRPFPTFASSCILPVYLYVDVNGVRNNGNPGGGGPGGCELAYTLGLDPQTDLPYVPNPTVNSGGISANQISPGYPGFDPSTAPNHGEGFYKQLGGNELPNAPHWTATVTGDYTVPLPSDWLMTLHSDVHWQSQSWWRVFNDSTYDKLHPYFTMNLAAIFTNEDAGWTIMAYIKNVTDETAITGAFLNSDDTGLTTNVFLTEPRLYGLRVTKNWTGGPLLGSFGASHAGPSPFTLELGGQVQRHDAPNQALMPSFASAFTSPLNIFEGAQNQNLDWGDGSEAKVTWRSQGSGWTISAGARFGKTNGRANPAAEKQTDPVCLFGGYFSFLCTTFADDPKYGQLTRKSKTDRADVSIWDKEEHQFIDLMVGRDVGIGGLSQSTISVGLRHAKLTSVTVANLKGIPDWNIPEGVFQGFNNTTDLATHTLYDIDVRAGRRFEGAGPVVNWEAAIPLLNDTEAGRVDLNWAVGGGVLWGDRDTVIDGVQQARNYRLTGFQVLAEGIASQFIEPDSTTLGPPIDIRRSNGAAVPTAAASLGLSYNAGGFNLGAGYRWERYFNAIDGGFAEEKSYDRTIDGPYLKVSVGFGG
jgi:outer membrane receptor protein involved in Fe transport